MRTAGFSNPTSANLLHSSTASPEPYRRRLARRRRRLRWFRAAGHCSGKVTSRPKRSRSWKVLSRAVRLLANGNRQIIAFFWPGDVVMPAHGACQQFTAEAVTNCRVRLSGVSSVCHGDQPCGARQVFAETLSLVTSMSQKNSVARIAWFLLRIAPHLQEDPRAAARAEAPGVARRHCRSYRYFGRNRLQDAGGVQGKAAYRPT